VHRCSGRRDFAEKVLQKFRSESVQTLDSLTRAVNERNGQLAARTAHSLKGMAATVAADSLRQAAADAEATAARDDWNALQSQLDHLRECVEQCLAIIPTQPQPSAPPPPVADTTPSTKLAP